MNLPKDPTLGQVWTPCELALEMARECFGLRPDAKLVLDPACGPATFSKALHDAGAVGTKLYCYDVDSRMVSITKNLNQKLGFYGDVFLKDYLADTSLKGLMDLVIMNPPYIRHEDIPIDDKNYYHNYLSNILGTKIDRRSNLFILFLLKGLVDLDSGGIMCAILYDAVSQTGYGKKALQLMARHAELMSQKHVRAPFDDVLVDAQVMIYRKRPVPVEIVESASPADDGLVSLSELLSIRRGTGVPLRKLFVASKDDPYFESAKPFFVKQSKLSGLVVKADTHAYLLKDNSHKSYKEVAWLKLRSAELGVTTPNLTVSGISGSIVFNYYIRNAARHLWNAQNVAISDNFYVSNVKGDFSPKVAWLLLNSEPYLSRIISAARNQGNGLSKLQLYEYKDVRVPDWRRLSEKNIKMLAGHAAKLIDNDADYTSVRKVADKLTKDLFDE